MNDMAGEGIALWDRAYSFFYDVILLSDGRTLPVRARSMVGLVPLVAVMALEPEVMRRLPRFSRRMQWFLDNRPHLGEHVVRQDTPEGQPRWLLSLVNGARLQRLLGRLLDESEFLSPFGVRSLSAAHRDQPFVLAIDGHTYSIDYEPGESTTGLFGGNSNWRGPVWLPLNFLIIKALERLDQFYGSRFQTECPAGSGHLMPLAGVAQELSRRLIRLFRPDATGRRPAHGRADRFQTDPRWRDLILFYEYFDGDTGAGLGASHQTGWTALVAHLLAESASGGIVDAASVTRPERDPGRAGPHTDALRPA
jgi:hypothetical protein